MSIVFKQDPYTIAMVMDLVKAEKKKALSMREWKHRLAGYGYAIKDTDQGMVLETLPHRVAICTLPEQLSH
ncbi:hypothetical protein [Thalassococcus sp. S3]|uniref:hypothetical protein n=1 Tax=Thalassococcus sp. S3 TaxID=2017482 RepID=UPI00102470F0|nr:hypothetical protein [Thalassococcus sp. S3]QBF34036.1 hypothetical protein CFI11_22915 [Thalassococcus sp. S3]